MLKKKNRKNPAGNSGEDGLKKPAAEPNSLSDCLPQARLAGSKQK